MMMRVASFFPFQTTYYLNGHSFIEQELNRARNLGRCFADAEKTGQPPFDAL
jgi:hypothetical protein